ncbi:RmlC-like cupin domain-containing protein [Earliella scabrosa]|nr:RmlC-like cupin domain-containing protein [Earliella scabrosa]
MHAGNTTVTAKALLPLAPLTTLRVSRHQIPAHGRIPNTSIQHRPLIIYHGAFPAPTPSAAQIEAHINAVGVCKPMWRYPMYPDDHFHTTAHEFLVIWRGRARLNFGGEGCPGAVVVELGRGDAILIPAGVSHRLVQDLEGGFEMVGSYMVDSEHWDLCYGRPGEEEHVANIKNLPWFTRDPLYGDGGPAVRS